MAWVIGGAFYTKGEHGETRHLHVIIDQLKVSGTWVTRSLTTGLIGEGEVITSHLWPKVRVPSRGGRTSLITRWDAAELDKGRLIQWTQDAPPLVLAILQGS